MVNSARFCMNVGRVAGSIVLVLSFSVPTLAQSATEIPTEISFETPSETPTAAEVAAAATAGITQMRLVLSLGARQVSLYEGERLISSYPVAVGAAETPTPVGQFTVSQMVVEPIWQSPWTGELHEPGANTALGLRWIGFSTTEQGAFGFHGTPTVESIGQAASNGCVRMHNEDIVALFEQVTPGMVVLVTP